MTGSKTAAPERAAASPAAHAPALSREAVEARSKAGGEPAWMRRLRLEALALYAAAPEPAPADDLWRRTGPDAFPVAAAGQPAPGWACAGTSPKPPRGLAARLGRSENERGAVIIRKEGEPPFVRRDRSLADAGVVFMDFAEAMNGAPELLRDHFATAVKPGAGRFEALHAALWTSGVLVYVPRGKRIELPLRTVTVGARNGAAQMPHLLVVADEGASVTVVDEQLSPNGNGAAFELPVTEVIVGRAATV
ncbi:MAG: hypothetical protein FJ313_01905, partial [Gemmatimonadetes bacterium]|nr:hypothetical protein [Gemmatimonadota bacterium]